MSLWFWGWLVTAGAIAVASALARDRFSAPFAAGAAGAAALEAAHIALAWQWAVFALASSVLLLVIDGRRDHYVPRHHARGAGRHGVGPAERQD